MASSGQIREVKGTRLREDVFDSGVDRIARSRVELVKASGCNNQDANHGDRHDHQDQSVFSGGLAFFVLHIGSLLAASGVASCTLNNGAGFRMCHVCQGTNGHKPESCSM